MINRLSPASAVPSLTVGSGEGPWAGRRRRRSAALLVALGALAMQTGCTAQEAQGRGEGGAGQAMASHRVVPIAPDRVRSYLAGAAIPPPETVSDFPTEMFFDNGHYRLQGRGAEEGTYEVSGNRVCVRLPPSGEPRCRYAYLIDGAPALSTAGEAAAVTPENSQYLKRRP